MIVYISVGPWFAVHAGYDETRGTWYALGRDDRIFSGTLDEILERAVRYRYLGETITREQALEFQSAETSPPASTVGAS